MFKQKLKEATGILKSSSVAINYSRKILLTWALSNSYIQNRMTALSFGFLQIPSPLTKCSSASNQNPATTGRGF